MSFAPAVSFSRPWTRAADLAAGEGVDLSAERRRRGLWSRVSGGGMESRGCKAGSGIEGPRHGLAAAQSAANALVSGGGTEYRGTVRRSKRLNVVQSHIEYIDGEHDSVLETHDLEDNGNQVDIRDDRVDNISVSDKNKTSCSMVKTSHTAGTKSFARWAEDLVELENIITEHPELAQSEHGRVAWKGDALHKVLGNEKPGQVHGMGLLPVPNQVYGRKSRYLKNINVTTIDGSSHDGGADAMEEIAKLKQLIEQQDKIIDALRNNDGFSGANEITMVGTQVILKSSTYPNKRHVAHDTILSCKSKQLVGGVELGRQFIEVQVDQPIDECELLIERFSG
ncbi:hypothetical protein D1007_55036 [Hordeum vulgare]|nr:hypothetical protein D1007_55036 [Hordeum vulgare]